MRRKAERATARPAESKDRESPGGARRTTAKSRIGAGASGGTAASAPREQVLKVGPAFGASDTGQHAAPFVGPIA